MTGAPILVRMDSGSDSLGNIKVCREEKARTSSSATYGSQESGEMEEPRPGKQVWQGERYVERPGIDDVLRMVF